MELAEAERVMRRLSELVLGLMGTDSGPQAADRL